MDLAEGMARAADATDTVLRERLGRLGADGRTPQRLLDATRHALLGGGKRFRPFLVQECARMVGGDGTGASATAVGAAFECLHAYSLVHDDLPAMDDDDLRRGRPTVHKAFDEATAILVGDGLQALAFQLLCEPPVRDDKAGRLALLLAEASGFSGMVGGQYRDLNAIDLDAKGVREMQAMKTGALIRGACIAGGIVADADAAAITALGRFGGLIGEAFQLADDLLDLEGTVEETGKRVGKDAAVGKATLAALIGAAAARERLGQLVREAGEVLRPYGKASARLVAAAEFVAARRS